MNGGRVLNRVLLLLVALVLFAVAAAAGSAVVGWPTRAGILASLDDPTGVIARLGLTPATAAIVVAAVLVLVALVLIVLIVSRRPRHRRTAIEAPGVSIDTALVTGVLRDVLDGATDVVTVDATTFRRRRDAVLRVRVQVRPRADLAAVVDQVDTALRRTRGLVGAGMPTVVWLTSGVRARFAHARRVD